MKFNVVCQRYGIEESQCLAFWEYLKKSNCRYTQSFWKGIDIADDQDIAGFVEKFKKGYTKSSPTPVEYRKITQSENQTMQGNISNLVNCPDCGKQVSRRAQACIHCGCPMSAIEETILTQFYGVKIIDRKWLMGTPASFISKVSIMNGLATQVKDTSILASGITKDRAEMLLNYLTTNGGKGELFFDTKSTNENTRVTRFIDDTINPNVPITCPKCRSTEIVIGQRGYSVVTGAVGSGKTTNRCGKCGYKWHPESLMK